MDDIEDDSNTFMSVSVLDNNETQDPLSPLPSTSTADYASADESSRQLRLLLLDGTYFKYLSGESSGNKITALCMKCPEDMMTKVKGYTNCTSNFLSHLKRKHGQQCIEEYKTYVKKKRINEKDKPENIAKTKVSKNKSDKNKPTQDQFDDNILKYFIHSMIPLRAIEDPYFLKIFTDLEISEMHITLMSRRTLGRRIADYYEKQVTTIKSELSKVEYVCTALDIWSSKKRSFIGVTVHWIKDDLRRASVALACQRFKGVHSYDRLSEIIQEINADFNLNSNKIVASVTDNGSNFVKAFQTFGVKLSNVELIDTDKQFQGSQSTEDSSESDDEETTPLNPEDMHLLPVHLRCCAHTLSLCATTDANKVLSAQNTTLSDMHAAIMKKCNVLWKAAARPKSAEIIQDVLQHTLSRPGETRWNSLFDSLKQIQSIKEKSLLLHRSLNIKNVIKENEFEYIKEYLICAAPVAEALDIMQSETNTYYGIVMPCLLALRKKLLKIERRNNFAYCKPLIEAYRQGVENRFKKFFDVTTPEAENAAIAGLSYPRFKNKWLTCLEPSDRTKILKIFKTCISKQINENETATVGTRQANQENIFFNFDADSSDSDTSMTETNSSAAPMTKAELLMLHFFAEESQDLQLLDRYPEIKAVFIRFNTPLPSSASVERLFSFATMTNLPKSHKLSDSMFEKRVVLKCNLNYYNK